MQGYKREERPVKGRKTTPDAFRKQVHEEGMGQWPVCVGKGGSAPLQPLETVSNCEARHWWLRRGTDRNKQDWHQIRLYPWRQRPRPLLHTSPPYAPTAAVEWLSGWIQHVPDMQENQGAKKKTGQTRPCDFLTAGDHVDDAPFTDPLMPHRQWTDILRALKSSKCGWFGYKTLMQQWGCGFFGLLMPSLMKVVCIRIYAYTCPCAQVNAVSGPFF